ncbi:MAG: heme-binding domain-containing protein [Planctomycetes bacterium]|nr:heme-binding domain-containing protein [Planctomycetota bacterium]
MKRASILVVVVFLLILAVPIANLVVGVPDHALSQLASSDPRTLQAAAILGRKCLNCHSTEPNLPFYAKFPGASQLIQADIRAGLRHVDLATALPAPPGGPVLEVALARIEHVLEQGSMPPLRYQLLHWTSGLSSDDEEKLFVWIGALREKHYASAGVAEPFRSEVVQPLPGWLELDAKKAALGEDLYHDPRLSGDDATSCATCHALEKAGTDRLRFSRAVGGRTAALNAPTTLNAQFQFAHSWDGRAATLEEQAVSHITDPAAMGATWSEVVVKLEKDTALAEAFRAVDPGGITQQGIVGALAEYARSLLTPGCALDGYLQGDASALTEDEKEGLRIFKASGCATCHCGNILGGRSFEIMGLRRDYFGLRGDVREADNGRYNVTGLEADRFRFKVPTLRNIAETPPYFHDGSTSDLRAAVRTMDSHQVGGRLSELDLDRVMKFLRTLTGKMPAPPER